METISNLLYGFGGRPTGWSHELWQHALPTLRYINELAAKCHHDIDHWDVLVMFRQDGKKRKLVEDRNEINRIFFERFEQEKENLDVRLQKAKEFIEDEIKFCADRFNNIDEAALRERRDVQIAHIDELNDQLKDAWDSIREYDVALFKGKLDYDVKQQVITALEKLPFYQFQGSRDGVLKFLTPPIILSEKNPAAGLDISVPMGSFQVCITHRFDVFVNPHEDNVRVRNYYHPHVDTKARICWGDAYNNFNAARVRGCIVDILSQVMAILCHFNPGNPFAALAHFKEVRESEAKKREFLNTYNNAAELERQALAAQAHDPNNTYHAILELDPGNHSIINLLVHTPRGVFRRQFNYEGLRVGEDEQRAINHINQYRIAIENDVRNGREGNHMRVRGPAAPPPPVPAPAANTGAEAVLRFDGPVYEVPPPPEGNNNNLFGIEANPDVWRREYTVQIAQVDQPTTEQQQAVDPMRAHYQYLVEQMANPQPLVVRRLGGE